MATPRRLAALLAASAIAIAACGSNDGGNGSAGASTAPGQSAAPASQAPAVSTGTVSGELTVWGMGNEGAKLDVLAKDFMAKAGYPNGEGFPTIEVWFREEGGYNGAILPPMAQYLQAQFKDILGITMNIKVMPGKDWMEGMLARKNNIPVTDVTNALSWARREFRRIATERLREICGSEKEFQLEARALFGRKPSKGGS